MREVRGVEGKPGRDDDPAERRDHDAGREEDRTSPPRVAHRQAVQRADPDQHHQREDRPTHDRERRLPAASRGRRRDRAAPRRGRRRPRASTTAAIVSSNALPRFVTKLRGCSLLLRHVQARDRARPSRRTRSRARSRARRRASPTRPCGSISTIDLQLEADEVLDLVGQRAREAVRPGARHRTVRPRGRTPRRPRSASGRTPGTRRTRRRRTSSVRLCSRMRCGRRRVTNTAFCIDFMARAPAPAVGSRALPRPR